MSAGFLGFFDDGELLLLLPGEVDPTDPTSVGVLAGDGC